MINKINTFGSYLLNGRFTKLLAFSLALIFSFNVGAQDAAEVPAVSGEVAYILNTFLFLVCGFLVMFMAAGFCILEAGQVRSNTAVISKKYGIVFYYGIYVLFSRIQFNV